MLTLTLDDLVMAQEPLQRLIEKEVPATVAYRLARIIRRVNPELRDYDAARTTLLERVGTLSEDGAGYDIAPERRAEFASEIQALLDTEVGLDIVQIAEEDMPDLSAADAMALWWLVREPEEEAT